MPPPQGQPVHQYGYDAEHVKRQIDCEGTDMSKVHFSREMEVYYLSLNNDKFTFLLPVALIPT